MMCPAYDTSEGITRALTSLERFHRLLEDRRSAHARGEALTEFCVRGRWWLDDRGGTRIALIKGKRSSVRSLFPELPDVVPAAELLGLLTETHDVAWGLAGLMVPPVGLPCAGCGKTWTMDTAGDFRARRVDEARDISEHIGRSLAYVRRRLSESYPGRPTIANWVRNPGDFGDGTAREVPDGYVTRNGDQVFVEAWRAFHTACWESKARTEAHTGFRLLLALAGFGARTSLRAIPNAYGSEEDRGPWYEAWTDRGVIKLGWQAHIINIDWSLTGRELPDLFEAERVTKTATMVHANDEVQALRFLTRLRDALTRDPALAGVIG